MTKMINKLLFGLSVVALCGCTSGEDEKEVVNDPESEFNGQSYYLHTCDVQTHSTLFRGNRLEELDIFIASADKKEKIKNNRTLIQLIKSENADRNTYRHKLLSENEFSYISERCGHRMEGFVSHKLSRLYKKGKL